MSQFVSHQIGQLADDHLVRNCLSYVANQLDDSRLLVTALVIEIVGYLVS